MSTKTSEHIVIIEYWFRVLCQSSISITDIIKIIDEFASEYESLDLSISADKFSYHEENGMIYLEEDEEWTTGTAYGLIIATPGRKYHWKIKFVKKKQDYFRTNIGVINTTNAPYVSKHGSWWNAKGAYSYYDFNGDVYSGDFPAKRYGETYKCGDTIDIWLDLRDDKNTIAWDKNGRKSDKEVKVAPNTDYRFVMTTTPGEIQLILLEVSY